MAFTNEQIAALSAKLDARHVAHRTQQGKSLSYIEGWHAIAEANRIFGFDGWQRETVALHMTGEPYQTNGKWRVGYLARVVVRVWNGDTWLAREGTGYGSGIGGDLNDAHESAAKEAETDAMKRALMTFGNPFGLALYDKAQNNVEHGAQTVQANVNPAATDPGGEDDQLAKWTAWADEQAKEIDACVKAGNIDRLKLWRSKNDKFIQSYCRRYPDKGDSLTRLFDDAYSQLAAATMAA